jgi:hypothetical protein
MNDEEKVQPDLVVGHEGEPHQVSYNKRDLLLYAVGIGYDTQLLLAPQHVSHSHYLLSRCKNNPEELQFLYEDHENFAAFPTFPIVLPFKGTSHDVVPFPSPTLFSFPPGLPVMNPAMTLHAEQV